MRACIKLWSALAIGFVLLAGSLRAEFLYVANAFSDDVSAYRISPNGALTPVAGSPFPTLRSFPDRRLHSALGYQTPRQFEAGYSERRNNFLEGKVSATLFQNA
jgi:hypothetical protein